MTKEEFCNQLLGCYMNDTKVSKEQNLQIINEFENNLSSAIPPRIYRIRSFNEYSLNALENDEVWGTLVSLMNDSLSLFINLSK